MWINRENFSSFFFQNKLTNHSKLNSTKKSPDESNELWAVGIRLSSQKSYENQNDNIVNNVTWVFNDWISDQENCSDILETVWSQQKSNSSSLNSISQNWLDFLANVALCENSLSLLDQHQEFSLGNEVVWVLKFKQNVLL